MSGSESGRCRCARSGSSATGVLECIRQMYGARLITLTGARSDLHGPRRPRPGHGLWSLSCLPSPSAVAHRRTGGKLRDQNGDDFWSSACYVCGNNTETCAAVPLGIIGRTYACPVLLLRYRAMHGCREPRGLHEWSSNRYRRADVQRRPDVPQACLEDTWYASVGTDSGRYDGIPRGNSYTLTGTRTQGRIGELE